MTLYELSFTYEHSAELLRGRMRELHRAEIATRDRTERQRLRRRMAELEPLLREMRELAVLSRRYYDRSYHKNEKYSL